MSSLLVILIGTVLVNTFLLMHHDEALGGDRDRGSGANAIRIASASLVTIFFAVSVTLAILSFDRDALGRVALFIYSFSVVSIAIGLHRATRRRLPRLRRSLASSPILIVSNSLALGAALLESMTTSPPLMTILYAVSLGIAFAAMLIIFVTLASRITEREVPSIFRLAPITLVSAGLVALALMGFTGLVRM